MDAFSDWLLRKTCFRGGISLSTNKDKTLFFRHLYFDQIHLCLIYIVSQRLEEWTYQVLCQLRGKRCIKPNFEMATCAINSIPRKSILALASVGSLDVLTGSIFITSVCSFTLVYIWSNKRNAIGMSRLTLV